MIDRPLISCVVPTFNAERFLGQALDSILRQSYRPIEVIVADDGSTDGTAGVAAGAHGTAAARLNSPKSLGRGIGPVRWVSQPTRGPAATRNLGLSAATGPFVAFLDADDLWHADKLALQMARFQARPELGVVVCHVQWRWEAEVAEEGRQLGGLPRAGVVPGYVSSAMLARRAAFERVGPFNPALWFGDSLDWFARAADAGVAQELMPQPLVRHRAHGDNLSRRRRRESLDEFLQILKTRLDLRRARSP